MKPGDAATVRWGGRWVPATVQSFTPTALHVTLDGEEVTAGVENVHTLRGRILHPYPIRPLRLISLKDARL